MYNLKFKLRYIIVSYCITSSHIYRSLESEEAMDEDELMIQWFELVNAKNDLVRKEADLMYQQRQQELEVLHEELEYDLRCLMNKPGIN